MVGCLWMPCRGDTLGKMAHWLGSQGPGACDHPTTPPVARQIARLQRLAAFEADMGLPRRDLRFEAWFGSAVEVQGSGRAVRHQQPHSDIVCA